MSTSTNLESNPEEVEEEMPGKDASGVKLYDFIMDFVKGEELASQEDNGMSSLLTLQDLISKLKTTISE